MQIEINIKNKIATAAQDYIVICGNSDYVVKFAFDSDWDGYEVKTARFGFTQDGVKKFIDVPFTNNECNMPVLSNVTTVEIGVYAGELKTTTPCLLSCKKSILCDGGAPAEPEKDTYNEIITLCNEAVTTANSVEERANNGEFNGKDGAKGEKGEKGEKGDTYILTDDDKNEIAGMVDVSGDEEKPWTLIEDITLTEAVTKISIPWDKLQVKELYIEGTIIPVETSKTSQTIQFGLSGTHYWQGSANPKGTGKIHVTMQVYKSPSGFTIFDGVITIYPYTSGGAHFIGRSENFKGDYVCPDYAKNLWIRSTVTADTGFDIGTNLRFWGR